jgi:hypothetical protein
MDAAAAAGEPFSTAYRTFLGPKYAASFKSEELWPAHDLIKHLDKTLHDATDIVMFTLGGRSGRNTQVRFQLASKPGLFFCGDIDYESSFDLFDSGPKGYTRSNWPVHVSRQPLRVEVDDEEDDFITGGSWIHVKETAAELYCLDEKTF